MPDRSSDSQVWLCASPSWHSSFSVLMDSTNCSRVWTADLFLRHSLCLTCGHPREVKWDSEVKAGRIRFRESVCLTQVLHMMNYPPGTGIRAEVRVVEVRTCHDRERREGCHRNMQSANIWQIVISMTSMVLLDPATILQLCRVTPALMCRQSFLPSRQCWWKRY